MIDVAVRADLGMGRELFGLCRGAVDEAEMGASAIFAGAGL